MENRELEEIEEWLASFPTDPVRDILDDIQRRGGAIKKGSRRERAIIEALEAFLKKDAGDGSPGASK